MTVKIAYHPDGTRVTFDDEWHTYRLDNGKRLTSGTKYIKQFFPEFDKEKIGQKYADKHGMELQEVLDMWAAKGKAAAQFGTDIHEYAEQKIIGGMTPVFSSEKHIKYCQMVDLAIAQLNQKFELIEAEKIIFSHKHLLGGMIDILMRDKSDNDVVLLDWKTNAKLSMHNPWQPAFPPYQNILTDCNCDHYRCQLNLYRRILKDENYFPEDTNYRMALIHVTEDKINWIKIEQLEI